ncbi:MAG: 2-hydroxyacid dehydrogenase [Phycisphaerales bacterium]|nr:2-hydroxyacid dehydrogenase [Phycisphaerales bacterium]
MRVAVFSTHPFDRTFLAQANQGAGHELHFVDAKLSVQTLGAAQGCKGVCLFVSDVADAAILKGLHAGGTRLLALRSAGFNNVDLSAADALGMTVARVPAYSPHAVAEHAVGLMLMLNRKLHRAHNRVREQNFALDGLLGFDMHAKVVGIVGVGKIGACVARIMLGFGCRVLAYDLVRDEELAGLGVEYVDLERLLRESDVVTLHCPLTPQTRHLINADRLATMKPGVMIINTSRGAVIDTKALIAGLKRGHVGYVGLDVYEEEGDLFFRDLSEEVIQDDVFARLQTFPNVVVTAHQAFFTREALTNIAETTLDNITRFDREGRVADANQVTLQRHAPRP